MSLHAQLAAEIKAAMLARDADRLSTLRLLKSALGYVAIEKQTETLLDADFLSVVQKEVKKRRDASEQFQAGGRAELAAKELAELKVLEIFLPQPLSAEELEALVKACIRLPRRTWDRSFAPRRPKPPGGRKARPSANWWAGCCLERGLSTAGLTILPKSATLPCLPPSKACRPPARPTGSSAESVRA
jgi:uncharacterized protein